MIHQKCFSSEWITELQSSGVNANRHIIEKSIRALALLGHLSDSGLDFIFKGGTSLLLHLNPLRRLSIDIDIVCGESKDVVDEVLKSIAAKYPFEGYSEDERGSRGLPHRRHFRFKYPLIEKGNQQPFIILDIVEESECPLPIVTRKIKTNFIDIERDVNVKVPTVEGLLGDKLTAFAPNTVGVPFRTRGGESQELQVAKQLFDIGELFNAAEKSQEIISAYKGNCAKEAGYRDVKHSETDALLDTIKTCFNFCGQGLKKFPVDQDSELLAHGCLSLQNHLIDCRFNQFTDAKTAASKAAFIVALILANKTDTDLSSIKYSSQDTAVVQELTLKGKFTGLSRLKGANAEAFYYWARVQELIGMEF